MLQEAFLSGVNISQLALRGGHFASLWLLFVVFLKLSRAGGLFLLFEITGLWTLDYSRTELGLGLLEQFPFSRSMSAPCNLR